MTENGVKIIFLLQCWIAPRASHKKLTGEGPTPTPADDDFADLSVLQTSLRVVICINLLHLTSSNLLLLKVSGALIHRLEVGCICTWHNFTSFGFLLISLRLHEFEWLVLDEKKLQMKFL